MKPIHLFAAVPLLILPLVASQYDEGVRTGQRATDEGTRLVRSTPVEPANPRTLEGMIFITDFYDPSSNEPATDTLRFSDGSCRSTLCNENGFTEVSFSETALEDAILFEATSYSQSEGKMEWKGIVLNGRVEGDVVWRRDGERMGVYHFHGNSHPPRSSHTVHIRRTP